MRYCTDHSVHGGLERALRKSGADVVSARLLGPYAPDAEILAFAAQDNRILVSQDTDFGTLVFRDRHTCCGVVLVRFEIKGAVEADETAARILALPQGGLGLFTTLNAGSERSRSLP